MKVKTKTNHVLKENAVPFQQAVSPQGKGKAPVLSIPAASQCRRCWPQSRCHHPPAPPQAQPGHRSRSPCRWHCPGPAGLPVTKGPARDKSGCPQPGWLLTKPYATPEFSNTKVSARMKPSPPPLHARPWARRTPRTLPRVLDRIDGELADLEPPALPPLPHLPFPFSTFSPSSEATAHRCSGEHLGLRGNQRCSRSCFLCPVPQKGVFPSQHTGSW